MLCEIQTAAKFIRYVTICARRRVVAIAIYLLACGATVGCRCGLCAVDGHAMIKLEVNSEASRSRRKSDRTSASLVENDEICQNSLVNLS